MLRGPGWPIWTDPAMPRDQVLLLVRPTTTVVRCHPDRLARLEEAVGKGLGDPPSGVVELERRLSTDATERVPTEEVLYLEPAEFEPAPLSACIRFLAAADERLFGELCSACTHEDVALSEVELGQPCVVGLGESGQLVAAASYIDVGGPIADVGVLVHPDCRRGGRAGALAARVCEVAFERGRIPQWWSLASNVASLAVGRRLGFRHWGFEEGLRLVPRAVVVRDSRSG
jgi:GNAT superfamily N-acetyltransferase